MDMEWRLLSKLNMFHEHDLDLSDQGSVLKVAVDIIVHAFVDIEYSPKRNISTGRSWIVSKSVQKRYCPGA